MASVKWIKLSTDMFDNPKIKYIRTLPEGNNMLLIWVMIIAKAGKCNSNGYIFLTENIPYTTKMLADELKFDEMIVKLSLETFARLNMVQLEEQTILISGWNEHQNIEGLEKIREDTRKRVEKYRAKQKQAQIGCNVTCNVAETHGNDIEEELEKEKEEELEKENKRINNSQLSGVDCGTKAPLKAIISAWNSNSNLSKVTKLDPNTTRSRMLHARIKQYGVEDVLKAIDHISKSDFLQGFTSNFKITFDWFVKPNNFIKVLEGNYTNKEESNGTRTEQRSHDAEVIDRVLKEKGITREELERRGEDIDF